MLGPGPEDLVAMGPNLMSGDRRRQVLETSLRTSLAALLDPAPLARLAPTARAPSRARRAPRGRLMRVYLPTTLPELATAYADGAFAGPARRARRHGRRPGVVRQRRPRGARVRGVHGGGRGIAAAAGGRRGPSCGGSSSRPTCPTPRCARAPASGSAPPSVVTSQVPLRSVASVHVDEDEAADVVRRRCVAAGPGRRRRRRRPVRARRGRGHRAALVRRDRDPRPRSSPLDRHLPRGRLTQLGSLADRVVVRVGAAGPGRRSPSAR